MLQPGLIECVVGLFVFVGFIRLVRGIRVKSTGKTGFGIAVDVAYIRIRKHAIVHAQIVHKADKSLACGDGSQSLTIERFHVDQGQINHGNLLTVTPANDFLASIVVGHGKMVPHRIMHRGPGVAVEGPFPHVIPGPVVIQNAGPIFEPPLAGKTGLKIAPVHVQLNRAIVERQDI